MNIVNAKYYDGQSARQQADTLTIAQGLLEVHGEELLRVIPLSNLHISAKLGRSPRLLHFADGGHCEVYNHGDFETLLAKAGVKPLSLLSRLETSWRYMLLATLLAISFVIASFYWGLPWVAEIAAARIPASVALSIDAHFLSAVDDGLMQPTRLKTARQQALGKKFDALQNENGIPVHQLEFRSSKDIGANAFALPGGTIVVTDQLVSLAANDEEILAVLAHELGHVSERHPLRQLLQSSVVGLAMTWYLGDISTLLAAAPTLLLETSYSRNFERRADRYAANMLRLNGISPARSKDHTSRIAELFSTHPDTEERIRALRSEN
jgi:Zn-dependent protease with chaperone function